MAIEIVFTDHSYRLQCTSEQLRNHLNLVLSQIEFFSREIQTHEQLVSPLSCTAVQEVAGYMFRGSRTLHR
jgi:hypothetical protein